MDAASHASSSALKQLRELASRRASGRVHRECSSGNNELEKTGRGSKSARSQVNISLSREEDHGLAATADKLGVKKSTLAHYLVVQGLSAPTNNDGELSQLRDELEELHYFVKASTVRMLAAVGLNNEAIREFIAAHDRDGDA